MSIPKGVLTLCIVFYLANQASSLKCYFCNSDADADCMSNPKKTQTCPGSRSINSDSKFTDLKGSSSISALARISALIGSEVSIAPRALTDPQCLKLTGFDGRSQGVIRMCIFKGYTDDQIKDVAIGVGLTSITISRCETDLCNSSGTLSISFLSLVSSLLLIFLKL